MDRTAHAMPETGTENTYKLECKRSKTVSAPGSFVKACKTLNDLVECIEDEDATSIPLESQDAETIEDMIRFHNETMTVSGEEKEVRRVKQEKALEIIGAVPEDEMKKCVNLLNASNTLFNVDQLPVYVAVAASSIKRWTKDEPEPTPDQMAKLLEKYPFLSRI